MNRKEFKEYMRELGAKGGASRSAKKQAALLGNAAKARAALAEKRLIKV